MPKRLLSRRVLPFILVLWWLATDLQLAPSVHRPCFLGKMLQDFCQVVSNYLLVTRTIADKSIDGLSD